MRIIHALLLISTANMIGCRDSSGEKLDLTNQNRRIDAEKWEFDPKSDTELKVGDTVTATFYGDSENSYCSTPSNRFKPVDSPTDGEEGKTYFVYKIEEDENDFRKKIDLRLYCTTKEGNGLTNGKVAYYTYNSTN